MQQITDRCLAAAKEALVRGGKVDEAIRQEALTINDGRYRRVARIATYLADMFPNRGTIMTQCFGETIVGMMLRESKERGKVLRVFCPETRPYFQGARLTATVVRDMGFDVTVITDNMPAYVMKNEQIDVFTSAADAICADGHVVNKIGTYQIAITAHFHGVPYFVTGAPDIGHPTVDTIHIEMRDPEFVLQAMGVRTAAEGVKGYYPSFDITPPHLVSGVVTDLGIFAPLDLARYFEKGGDSSKDLVV
jgi:methylthioribose-1-phosphate isomerase